MNRYNLLMALLATLFLLMPCAEEKGNAEGLAAPKFDLSSSGFLGFGDHEEGYLLTPSKLPSLSPAQTKETYGIRLPFNEENLQIAPVLQKTSHPSLAFQNDLSLMNNGYGLEYGVGIGYTLPSAQFYNIGEVKFTMNLMPRVEESSLFPQAQGLSKVELGVGYRPVDNAELFVKYMTLRDVLQRQDLFSSLADAVEVGAQLAF